MSNNQEFVIKINEIIGKSWLANLLDNSDGYVLSLKPFEQNSSSTVSPEERLTEEEKGSLNPAVENSNQKSLWNDISPTLRDMRNDFIVFFKKDPSKFHDFVKLIKNSNLHVIPHIEYKDLGTGNNESKNTSINGKFEALIQIFGNNNQLPLLQKIFNEFKKNNA